MKKLLVPVLFIMLSVNVIFAQRNPNFEQFKCSPSRSISNKSGNFIKNLHLNDYDVIFYKIDLNATNTTAEISGNTTVMAMATGSPLDTMVLEFTDLLTIDSVQVDSVSTTYLHANDEIQIDLINTVSVDSLFSVTVYYHGNSSSGGFFSGISNDVDQYMGYQVTWTLSEPYRAKEWFPCKQVLSDKADSVYVFITTSPDLKAGSNGILTNTVSLPGNLVRYEWKSNYPIDYYLISFTVADFMDYSFYAPLTGYQDSVLVQNYVYNSAQILDYFKIEIDQTADFLDLFSQLFGKYPFSDEKYGHCMAPVGGGMEHQTMTTLGWFDFDLVSHELAHMWFGDYVTCKTWQDIWINEGFAMYLQYVAKENLQSLQIAKSWLLTQHNEIMAEPGGSVYIPLQDVGDENRIFDYRLTYQKGAALVHMLRFELNNDTLFYQILRDYLSVYGDSVALGTDFKNFFEAGSGLDLTDFFDQWYYGEGYPTFSLVWDQVGDTLFINSTQTTSTTTTTLFKTPVEFRLNFSGGNTVVRVNQSANSQLFKIPVTHQIISIAVDPANWLLNKQGSVITRLYDQVIAENMLQLSPNPCTDKLTLQFNSSGDNSIQLADVTGRVLTSVKTNERQLELDMSDFNSGIYFLSVSDGTNSIVKKIVKE